ncbi:MAG: type II toxin-antitoxin system PemK/MazF family toxin [Firmicutes bacterium]|nr:type II toxin-antitoxin system PemK/MazF family toxin [Bacillota bacterium]
MVIQNNIGNEYSPVIIVAVVTSKIKKVFDIHVQVLPREGGLDKESI